MQVKKFSCNGKHSSLNELKMCPICSRRNALFNLKKNIPKEEFSGSAPSVFVGRFGYPNINVGILSLPEFNLDAWTYDAPRHWSNSSMSNADLVGIRSSLINSAFKSDVKMESGKYIDVAQETAMAKKHVDFEINLKDKPHFSVNFDSVVSPMGPRAKLKRIREVSNASVPLHVDKVNSDTDLLASDAVSYLQKHNYDENFISRILSVGTLGVEDDRKLVPTRWSITATDDMLGKNLINSIRDYDQSDLLAFSGDYMGNYYFVFFLSGIWSYELFEMYLPDGKTSSDINFTTDHEEFNGRKNYAGNTVGGYYTVRLAVAEKLKEMKRQSSVFVLRIITSEYKVPLGVWVTREASRKAVEGKGLNFGSVELMKEYLQKLVKKRFGVDISVVIKQSKLLNVKQKTLGEF